ncbi:hypothetical protein PIB30_063449 [Stylosanthes scabra]|uniref:RRM domain-containing protein n=1 Tax=Stylosanthes scabra TaxID=79078 RepID=A0ABU6RLR0_9FABA|nr:hypothetical protein [Stylosanthes scabra]
MRAPALSEEEIKGSEEVGLYQRELYKEFGKDGYIMDVFVSRKTRKKTMSPFAFIIYNSYGAAMKAIDRSNGKQWEEAKLFVTLSKFRRKMEQPKSTHTIPKTEVDSEMGESE